MEQNKGENKERRDCRGTLQRALNSKAHFIILTCIITLVLIATLGVVNLIENSERIREINSGEPKAEAEKISEEKVYSIFMVLNELSTRDDANLEGNKIKITNSEDLTISYFNAINGTPIEKSKEETIEVPKEGIKLKIDGIKEGQSYDIEVENAQTIEDYEETFKKATITVDASAEGELEAYVKEITKEDDVGASSTRPGSEEKVAIFAYEEEDTGRIKIKGNKDVEIYYVIQYNDGTTEIAGASEDAGASSARPEDIDESQWKQYNPEEGVQLEKNGVIYSKSKYKDGTYSEINTLHINNIDKLEPSIEVKKQEVNDTNSEVTVTISMQDQEATDEYGKSGIYGYAITSTQEEPEEFMPCEADEVSIDGVGAHSNVPVGEISTSPEEPITVEVGGITENGTYYAWTQDKAGNTSHKEITVTDIEDQEKHIVAIILDTPEEAEDLEGKEYYSLTELIQELDEKSITAKSEQVVIQIVADIKNESTKITDKNLVIDLNGYTIASKLQEPTIRVASGNVAIVDNKYDISDYISETKNVSETQTVGASIARPEDEGKSLLQYLQEKYQSKKQNGEGDTLEECDGRVYNEKYIAVQIDEGGTVTLGEDEGAASTPNTEAPKIRGGLKGVLNSGGTLNFYDGEIEGKVPVEGKITDTPEIYDPTLTSSEEEGIYRNILRKVSGIEALIGTTRYTRLEEAINTATNAEKQTQIDIVADIAKIESIIIDEDKNVLLNLNGYTVTNTSADYVIQNSGKLEIIDTTITEKDEVGTIKGKITSNTYSTISNKEGGTFKLTSGTITNSSKTIIQNEGTFELNGGYITTTSTSSSVYGIENLNNAKIITKAGIIKTYYYSIYNQNTATVTIEGGEVISTNYYPLFNNGTGKITVKEGKVTGYERVIQNQGNGEVIVEGGVTETSSGSSYVIYNNNAGKITVTGGTIIGNRASYGIYNYSTGEIIIKGGEIIAAGIYNGSAGNITIEGGTINSINGTAIYNRSTGTIKIKGGTINSTNRTAIYNDSTGTITIGKEDGIVENEKINIKGKDYGVYNVNGTLNYYDGTITGGKNAIRSVINDIEENHDVALENIEEGEQSKIIKQSQIAYIGNDQDTLYDSLQSAIDECANEEKTITLVKDITIAVAKIIQQNQNITLNLNGHKIVSYSYDSALINNGDLTITDELEGQISAYGTAIKNTGELIVSGGTISSDGEGTSAYSYGIYNEEEGTVKVTGGEINAKITGRGGSNAYSYAYGIYNEGTGTIEISGGTMSSTYVEAGNYCYASSYTVYNAGEGTVTIKDGANITGTAYGIYNNGAGEIDIEGGKITTTSTCQPVFNAGEGTIIVRDGTITGDYYAIRNESSGMIEIKGGNISSKNYQAIVNVGAGKIKITGGTITAPARSNYSVIENSSTGTIEIEGGEITAEGVNDSIIAVRNSGRGKITIRGGTISATQTISSYSTYNTYGIYNSSTGEIEITGGTITAEATTTDDAGTVNTYGIYNSSTGTITIGESEGQEEEKIPTIKATVISEYTGTSTLYSILNSYGIYNNGAGNIQIEKVKIDSSCTGKCKTATAEGIYNKVAGQIEIKKGEITAETTVTATSTALSYGTYNEGAGTIILGIKNNEVDSTTPKVKGEDYGLYNSATGTVNFYDGIVIGKEEQSITGTVADREENYSVVKYTSKDNKEQYNIEEGTEVAVLEQVPVAQVESTGQKYITLQEAFTEALKTEGDTVKLLTDISIKEEASSLEIEEGQNLILDLAGKTIIAGNENTIINRGTFKITDSSEGGTLRGDKGTIVLNEQNAHFTLEGGKLSLIVCGKTIDNKGETIISGGTISSDGEGTSAYSYGIYNEEEGTVKVTGGEINAKITGRGGSNAYSYAYGIYNEGTGTIEISGGTMSSTYVEAGNYCYASSYTVYNAGEGTVTIKDGANITGTAYGIYNNGAGEIDIEGGKITTTSTCQPVFNAGEGTIIVRDGTITGDYYAIRNESSGMIEIKGGNISSKNYQAIVNVGAGKIKITGGTITAPARSNYSVIENSSTGTIEIEGGEITAEGVNDSIIAVRNSGRGKITIRGGTISATQTISSYSTYNTYGIYNSSTGEIEITGGTITAEAITTSPSRTINSYGIYNYRTGTITIGENEGQVKQETPTITATASYTGTGEYSGTLNSYGLYNASGTVNFYDGTITGGTNAISGAVTNMPYGYQVKYEDSMKKATLELKADFEGAIQVDETYYDKLSTAIGVISNTTEREGTIHICQDLLNIDDALNIPVGTNITLALQGHQVTYINTEVAITNNGTLTIIDFEDKSQSNSDTLSLIKNENGTVIQNNGTLVIGQEGNGNQNSPRIEGQTAISGTDADLKSGELVGQHPSSIMAYSTSVMSLTNEEGQLVLSLKPETDYNSKEWTKENVKVDIQADIIPTLNLYSEMTRPPLSYTKTATIEPSIAHQTLETIETVGASIARPEGLELTETEVTAGDTITYTIQVHNEGEIEAKEVIVQDTVPMGTKLVQAENEGKEQDGEITWTIPTIEAGQTAEVSFIVEVEYAKEEYTIENTATVDGEETNTTQNQYKKPIAQLTSSLQKTTEQTVITSKEENIYYEIKFNANVNYFVGKATVTIVDTLPYPIDKENSTLSEGEYDSETQTITWEVEIENIDTFNTGEERVITITKPISLKYDYTSLENIKEPVKNKVESTIELLEKDEESGEGYIIVKNDDESSQVESVMEIPAEVVVHHYIYDEEAEGDERYTEQELVSPETKTGIVGGEYETSKSNEVPRNYECIDEQPTGYSGEMAEDKIEVKYYYKLLKPTIDNTIEKEVQASKVDSEGQAVLTKEDGEVRYTITYDTKITNYIGKAKIKIVDTLPGKIDTSRSEIGKGHYDSNNNTITWEEELENINTFTRGKAYTKTITKEITVVYIDQHVTEDLINKVKGETITYYPEGYLEKGGEEYVKGEEEGQATVKQEYKVNVKVEKVWEDNGNERQKRPESVTIDIVYNGETITEQLNAGNKWTVEKEGLPKYNAEGEKIEYTVTEKETSDGDLEYYERAEISKLETEKAGITSYNYTITNYYKLMTTDLNTEITKTGSTEITSKKDKVNYTINFSSEITNYIGEGKVTIVDTLPYKIDVSKSNIANGKYDEDSQTITWEKELEHINTETGENKNKNDVGAIIDRPEGKVFAINITKEISLLYKDIDLTEEKMTNNVKGRIELSTTEEVDEDTAGFDTNINVQGKVIIRYVNKDTGKDIVGESSTRPDGTYSYEITGKVGSTYNAEIKEFDNYKYVDEGKATGTIGEEEQEIILYYTKEQAKVIVKYQDKEGKTISPDVTIEGNIGEIYTTKQKEIANYRFVEVIGKAEGKMTEGETIVIYIYEKIPAKVIVRYLTKEESQNEQAELEEIEIADSDVIEGYVGDSYKTTRKAIENYVSAEPEPENSKGIMTEEDIEVKYYYEKLASGKITVKYVDIDTEEELTYEEKNEEGKTEKKVYGYEITGHVGDKYKTEEKEIPYYVYVNDTENTEGELTETGDTVIYYYRKQVFNFNIEKVLNKITLNGEAVKIRDNKLVKVELKSSQIENAELIVSYKIKVTNEGELAGKVKVLEKIPKGFEIFTKEDWIERKDGNLEAEVELDAEESKDLTVMLKWKNSEDNLGPMKNTAELIDSTNIANYDDIEEENDTSEATILVSIKTDWQVSTVIIITMITSMMITGYLILVIIRNFDKGSNIKNIKFLNK